MATWLMTQGKEAGTLQQQKEDRTGPASIEPTTREPPLIGIAAGLFAISFAGAAIYGVRAGRRAQLKEAAEAAEAASRSSRGVSSLQSARAAPAPAPSSSPKPPSPPLSSSSRSQGLDWGKAGTSAPSVLSRRGGGSVANSANTGAISTTTPPPSQRLLQESPALTAIKAFSIATALVAVGAAVSIEVGRRVWGIEDVRDSGATRVLPRTNLPSDIFYSHTPQMYDLTDRLHASIPKSFSTIESIGDYLRGKFAGIVPKPPQDQEDPLREPVPAAPSWLSSLFDQRRRPTTTQTQSVDELWDDIAQAETIRDKLELLESHLQHEKSLQDRKREELREEREYRRMEGSREVRMTSGAE